MGNSESRQYLSKSLFIKGLQCHKLLFLQKFHPELADEISVGQEMIFEGGTEAGILAQDLFPGGVEIPYDGLTHSEQIDRTRSEINRGAKTIYEATFSHDGVFVRVDILHKGKNGWEIHEVKSSTEVKDVYLNDASVQHYVISGEGLPVSKTAVVHINNEYVRNGDIDVRQLFTSVDVSEEIRKRLGDVPAQIQSMKSMLLGKMPAIDIGPHCSDPYACAFTGHCWQHIPDNSVFDLAGKGVKKFDLYRQDIVRLEDVPLEILNAKQRQQVEAYLGKTEEIDREALKSFLDSLWYPLCFLDFETFRSPVPPFDATWPYQQIPFQYSLHVQKGKGAQVKHFEYLAPCGKDPREELADKLASEIPADACVVVFNKGFEKGRLQELAYHFPRHTKKMENIIENLRDLADPFRKRDYYDWKLQGSYSLKAVLPVVVPELSYEDMEVSDGDAASAAYQQMCRMDDAGERERIRKALLEYCGLDTYALVRILERLREMV